MATEYGQKALDALASAPDPHDREAGQQHALASAIVYALLDVARAVRRASN